MAEKRDVSKEFYEIITPKDCGRYSKSVKDNYEDVVRKMENTLRDIVRKLENAEYTQYQPPVNEAVVAYYESIINAFKSSWKTFIETGKWDFTEPTKPSAQTLKMYDDFMEKVMKKYSYYDGSVDVVRKLFERIVKTLTKKGFTVEELNQKKAEEEEAKKPKLPETISFTKTDVYDPKRMAEYKANSRGEQIALNGYLQCRTREFYAARPYVEKYPIIKEYLNKIFNALDNAWFAYISGTTEKLDFSEANSIYEEYCNNYPVIKSFDSKACGVRMAVGGSYTYWDCKDKLMRMANSREKLIKTVTMEQEDTYTLWERSVDAILNDEGKPSLNAYLEDWVNEVVAYYTDEENITRWTEFDKQIRAEIKDINDQMSQIAASWEQEHANDRSLSWKERTYGYEKLKDYTDLKWSKENKNSLKASNDKDLAIANMGEIKIREMFKQQAADAKKAFITAVCSKAGVLKGGTFYWSEQHTGHLNGLVTGETGSRWKITSFFAGGYNIQRLHCRTKITELSK